MNIVHPADPEKAPGIPVSRMEQGQVYRLRGYKSWYIRTYDGLVNLETGHVVGNSAARSSSNVWDHCPNATLTP